MHSTFWLGGGTSTSRTKTQQMQAVLCGLADFVIGNACVLHHHAKSFRLVMDPFVFSSTSTKGVFIQTASHRSSYDQLVQLVAPWLQSSPATQRAPACSCFRTRRSGTSWALTKWRRPKLQSRSCEVRWTCVSPPQGFTLVCLVFGGGRSFRRGDSLHLGTPRAHFLLLT